MRIPSTQDIEDLYFQPARECLLKGDRNGFIRLHERGQEVLLPYSIEVPNLRWLGRYHSEMSNPGLLPDSPERLWYHEKSHCDVARKWGIRARPMLAKLRGDEHAMYTDLSMHDVSLVCCNPPTLRRFLYEVLIAPESVGLSYEAENELARLFK